MPCRKRIVSENLKMAPPVLSIFCRPCLHDFCIIKSIPISSNLIDFDCIIKVMFCIGSGPKFFARRSRRSSLFLVLYIRKLAFLNSVKNV